MHFGQDIQEHTRLLADCKKHLEFLNDADRNLKEILNASDRTAKRGLLAAASGKSIAGSLDTIANSKPDAAPKANRYEGVAKEATAMQAEIGAHIIELSGLSISPTISKEDIAEIRQKMDKAMSSVERATALIERAAELRKEQLEKRGGFGRGND